MVKKRLVAVIALGIVLLSFAAISDRSPASGAVPTISATTTTSTATIGSITSASTVTTNNTKSSTTTVSPTAELYRVDMPTLYQLVNDTDARFSNSTGPIPYYIVSENARGASGLVFLTTDAASSYSYGFRGEIGILAYVSTLGVIKSMLLWSSVEPMTSDITPQYLSTYTNRSVFDRLAVGSDVVSISGATFSSVAIAGGVRIGGRMVVNDYLRSQTVTSPTTSLNLTVTLQTIASKANESTAVGGQTALSPLASFWTKETALAGILAGFFAAAVLAYRLNDGRIKYGILAGSVAFLGFYTGRMVTVADVTIFLRATFPPLLLDYYWYVLYGGVILTSVVWGRLYCGSLCPFGAFTHLLHKISPLKYRVPLRFHSKLVYMKYGILALVSVSAAWSVFWALGLEPFETFFLFKGDSWMWGVLGIALVFSVPYDRFYCSYLCPAGAGMAVVGRMRLREINRWPECDTCMICERDCPTGAISGGRISTLECMNCRTCEVNYLNSNICPHYSSERANHS